MRTRRGFSLVELSIVLVILGLLVGGILAGQSLIRAAELRAVSTEYSRYQTAVKAFRDKYFGLPGDITNGSAFWGLSTDCSGASSTGTCNGNGDGMVLHAAAINTTGEQFQFWKQLALAGLVEGTYSGLAGGGGANHCVIGTNCPSSRLPKGGWGVQWFGASPGDVAMYAYSYGNAFLFGGQSSDTLPIGVALRPEEAWNIDTKIDEGRPGAGRVITRDSNQFGTATACTTSASATDKPGNYNLTVSIPACTFFFVNAM